MTDLDTRPMSVNISAYGGDTLTILVMIPETALPVPSEFRAQLRVSKESDAVAAEFVVIVGAVVGGKVPVSLVLASATTSMLVGGAAKVRVPLDERARTYALVQRWSGVWDMQSSSAGGGDPVTTHVQGTLDLDLDVTRH